MKREEKIFLDEIGDVTIKRHKTSKRLSIYIKPFVGVVVVMPMRYSLKDAVKFVESKKAWILESLEKIKVYENTQTIFDENTKFSTRGFVLKIEKHQINEFRMQLKNGILTIFYPSNMDVKDNFVQENIRYGIEEALRVEAKNYLPERLEYFAKMYGFRYKRVSIRNNSSRWGSCSYDNNINLNLHLMRLPSHLIDYVILHELCHIFEKNHDPNFWALLDKYTNGNAKRLAKEIKNYRTKIY